jgi:outer membrane lipoprotein-sorting protein
MHKYLRGSFGYFIMVLFLATGPMVSAQTQNFKEVSDLPDFRKKFALESAKVQSITSDFKQQKQLLALTETITSTGKFWFKRSDKIRIDYQKPFIYRMIMNGDKMQVKDDQKESTVNVKSNRLFQQVNRIMVDCIQGTILESKDFSTKVFENETTFRLEMTPVVKGLRDFFKTIVVLVDKKDYAVNSIEMNEPAGDFTIITFTSKIVNQPVNDEIFNF